jgi:uncharacterized protein involved in outer membrane biogenesis
MAGVSCVQLFASVMGVWTLGNNGTVGPNLVRLKRPMVAVCMLLAAMLAAIAIAVHLLVPRLLAPKIAASVKAETGRELGFGEVGVTLWPRPALALSQVRFGDASWGSQPWLAQVGRVTAEFDARALLSGRLRIRHVTVTDASVLVETNAHGAGNWVNPVNPH